ncbi:MAG: radical SAM protein [Nitrospirae bacterium]|nr:radical SAM protein [Nitrospirota bacterium]
MKKLKITFLNPPFLKKFSRSQRSPAVTKSGTIYYPMWLAQSAALAEREGHEIDFIDAPAAGHDLDYVIKRTGDFGPGLIVMDTSTPSIHSDIKMCEALKEVLPEVFILLVGTHVSALPEDTLSISPAIDAVAVGEYDYTVMEIADVVSRKASVTAVRGICFRSNGAPVCSERRPLIENLDELPFVSTVYKKFLDIRHYFNPNALFPMVTISTSRGCPFQCIFCVYPQTMMGHRMRTRSVKNVCDEIEYIANSFPGLSAIFFEDDTLAANKKRCIELCREIIDRRIHVSWTANARADLDYDTMKIMKESGCRCLCVGFESGSSLLLENIKKKITIDKMKQFMRDARGAGILIHGCFMVGHPGETKETMKQTLELAKELSPDTVQFYPIMVYPGTEAYAWYKERGLITTSDFSKWLTPAGLHNTVVKTEALTSTELVKFCDYARKEFYLRPGYMLYKAGQMLTNPHEMKRTLKSAKTFIKYLLKGSDVVEK